MASPTTRATLDDLYRVDGKAELISGRIVEIMPTGNKPSLVSGEIYVSLHAYAKSKGGKAYPDGVGYAVPELSSGRESFSPDVSYYDGPLPANRMRFIEGAPTFAVDVRSENDYGGAAEADMADKRADYFAAGTKVVWDVDPKADVVMKYTPDAPDQPVTFRHGDVADAEPAVPGWSVKVDDIFAV